MKSFYEQDKKSAAVRLLFLLFVMPAAAYTSGTSHDCHFRAVTVAGPVQSTDVRMSAELLTTVSQPCDWLTGPGWTLPLAK